MSDIEQRVLRIAKDQFGSNNMDSANVLDVDIYSEMNADSLDAVEFVIAAEDEFGIEITDAEAEQLTTIRQMVELVTKKVNTQ